MAKRVLVTGLMMLADFPRFRGLMAEKGIEAVEVPVKQFLTEPDLIPIMGEFDGWVAGDDRVTPAVLKAALPRLKVIAKWGTGVDSFDLPAAKAVGVPVYNAPGAFQHAVSEVALGYMLDVSRYLSSTDRAVRAGRWPKPCGGGLYKKTVGIVGFGAIGRGVAERAAGFGTTILAYDPMQPPAPDYVTYAGLPELLAQSDFVVLCCNMTQDNVHLINAGTLQQMKPGAILVNVGRGGLVDEPALIAALQSGHLGGAGLDVFEAEPLPADSPLRGFDNVVLGSHNANNQQAAIEAVHVRTLECLYQGLGLEPKTHTPVTDLVKG
ncbi:phosphoglycerate dehydrogenase [Xanthobacter agilis]|uniref:D-3-phosphoglycerate dehydrogenase n=1 Tax=Xanthobacter agilis TaxID=47492 RepID=A0ABU0LBU2_XANAG|nr:phosphoglycerate dehydrogenase [Xanthobacter agilis]MDQ0504605.1 D-3-phosphoglycerate dehydrogenase [Xanthobacter agilis]